jgi:AhpD family alkylhydroperoxidase
MHPRLNPAEASPAAYRAMLALDRYTRECGLEPSLLELVKTRASQINGCAFCVHMHSAEAMGHGETPARLLLLSAWRESPLYSDRERAALAWTEALTLLPERGAPPEVYEEAARHFEPKALVDLTVLIGLINAWNRLGVGFGLVHPVP